MMHSKPRQLNYSMDEACSAPLKVATNVAATAAVERANNMDFILMNDVKP